MDGTDWTQRHPGELGLSSSVPLCAARSRHEVLWFVSLGTGKWRGENDSTPSQEPESECVRGALGSFGQTRMLVQGDPVRGGFPGASPGRIQPTLSRRKKSSGERQPATLHRCERKTKSVKLL